VLVRGLCNPPVPLKAFLTIEYNLDEHECYKQLASDMDKKIQRYKDTNWL
jgi:hypothetical protein